MLFFSQDGKLGDAVVNTAFVAALRRCAPDSEIHATVAGATAVFWGADTRLTRLWPIQSPGWLSTIRTALAMRRERYDYIITWQRVRKEKNKLLLWLANPGKVIDLHDFNNGPLQHRIFACNAALAQMGLPADGELAYDIGMAASCAGIDALLPPGAEVILLNLFAADAERSLSEASARELLNGLRQQSPRARICVVCTDGTAAAARAIISASGVTAELVNCEGNLPRLLRLCQRADLVISPDTALIHIGSAYNRPVIGIYQNNAIKVVQWGPRSSLQARVMSDCKRSISGFAVADVLEEVRSLRSRYLRVEPVAELVELADIG